MPLPAFHLPMRSRILTLLAMSLAMVACGTTPEDHLVGIWTLDRESSQLPEIPAMPFMNMGFDAKQMEEDLVRNTRLKLLSDHTFVLSYSGIIDGKWTYGNGELVLTPTKKARGFFFGGTDFAGEVSPDFQIITVTRSKPIGDAVLKLKKTG